jgi:hypothetical protein
LGVELLLELGDLPLFGGGEVLGVVPAHLAPARLPAPANAHRSPPPAAEAGWTWDLARGGGGWPACAMILDSAMSQAVVGACESYGDREGDDDDGGDLIAPPQVILCFVFTNSF